MNKVLKFLPVAVLAISSIACKKEKETPKPVARDQVFQTTLTDVRLGDGVPLDINVAVRWKINDYTKFSDQFESPSKYDSLILAPKEKELANNVGNKYENVDSLFDSKREQFKTDLKNYLLAKLGEDGVEIKEVIVSDLVFPKAYIKGKENIALLEQRLEEMKKQTFINEQNAQTAKDKAKSDGEVRMAKAEAEAKIQKIKAETEKSIRKSKLAKAETDKQVARMRAQSDAERRRLLNKADLDKRKDLQQLAVQKQRDLNNVQLAKEQKREDMKIANEMKMAKLCSENPVYAKYIVNKELASKVKIAVLPSDNNANVFNGLLDNGLTAK